jgi:hypothetical protein
MESVGPLVATAFRELAFLAALRGTRRLRAAVEADAQGLRHWSSTRTHATAPACGAASGPMSTPIGLRATIFLAD